MKCVLVVVVFTICSTLVVAIPPQYRPTPGTITLEKNSLTSRTGKTDAYSDLSNGSRYNAIADSSKNICDKSWKLKPYAWCDIKDRRSTFKTITRSKRYVLQGSRWANKNITYKILKYPKGLNKLEVDAEIAKALNVWSEYSQLTFTTKENNPIDIEISFDVIENDDPFDGPGKVLARSYFPKSGGNVYFDSAEYWTIGKRKGINLFQAAAHEFGHALGLSHSKKKSALMAPFYRGYSPDFKLDQDDIVAIQRLYGKKEVSPAKS